MSRSQRIVFRLAPTTEVVIDGKKARPEDLKAGMAIQILADNDGRTISIVSPPPKS